LSSNSLNCEVLSKSFTSTKIHLFISCRVIVAFSVGKTSFLLCEDVLHFLQSSFIHDRVLRIKDRRFLISAIAYSTFLVSAISCNCRTVLAKLAAHVIVTENKTGTTQYFIFLIEAMLRSKVETKQFVVMTP